MALTSQWYGHHYSTRTDIISPNAQKDATASEWLKGNSVMYMHEQENQKQFAYQANGKQYRIS